jgi:hypothetical protein
VRIVYFVLECIYCICTCYTVLYKILIGLVPIYKPRKPKTLSCEASQVIDGLKSLLAKRASVTVRPSSCLQAIRRSNPILCGKPSKEFNFQGRPSLTHHLIHVGGDGT